MPQRKKVKRSAKPAKFIFPYKYFLIPSGVGGVIAWFASGSFWLGVIVFVFVLIGNWIGYSFVKKK